LGVCWLRIRRLVEEKKAESDRRRLRLITGVTSTRS